MNKTGILLNILSFICGFMALYILLLLCGQPLIAAMPLWLSIMWGGLAMKYE